MIFDLPCKLGEEFVSLKFVGWENGERIYKEEKTLSLRGFDKGLFDICCYGYKGETLSDILSYGEYGKHYKPCYKVCINDKYFESRTLSEWGFPSNRRGKLIGIAIKNGYVVAHFCMEPRYENVYYAIGDLHYDGSEALFRYNEDKDKERIILERELQEKIPHREELVLSEEDKNILADLVIKSAKKINLKLRRFDIDKEKMSVKESMGRKIYFCSVDGTALGTRAKKVPNCFKSETLKITDKKMVFTYSSLKQETNEIR